MPIVDEEPFQLMECYNKVVIIIIIIIIIIIFIFIVVVVIL